MCIRHFASQALRLTWSVNAHPHHHPSTHLSPLYTPPPPPSPHPHPDFVICLFGDARLLPGLFVLVKAGTWESPPRLCLWEALVSPPEWALKPTFTTLLFSFFFKRGWRTVPLSPRLASLRVHSSSVLIASHSWCGNVTFEYDIIFTWYRWWDNFIFFVSAFRNYSGPNCFLSGSLSHCASAQDAVGASVWGFLTRVLMNLLLVSHKDHTFFISWR